MVAATRKFLCLCCALALAGVMIPSAVFGADPASVPSNDLERRLAAVIAADHDSARLAAGLGSLGVRNELMPYADANTVTMVSSGTVGHSDIQLLISDFPTHDWAAENALVMYNAAGDATKLWLESPAHHDNMMAAQATHMAISVRCGADGRMWVTAQYVQDDQSPRVVPDPVSDADRALTCARPDARFAPFTNAEALVARQYQDILGRTADADGLAYWTGLLEREQISAARLVQLFMSTPEHNRANQQLRRAGDPTPGTAEAEVTTIYRSLLGRDPDASGLTHWASVVRSRNGDSTVVIGGFLASSEYAARVSG